MEEVKEVFKAELENEDVFLAPTFSEFCMNVVLKSRGGSSQVEIDYRPVEMEVNKMKIRFPCQLFINGEFVDAENGKTTSTVNPSNEEVICQVRGSRFHKESTFEQLQNIKLTRRVSSCYI